MHVKFWKFGRSIRLECFLSVRCALYNEFTVWKMCPSLSVPHGGPFVPESALNFMKFIFSCILTNWYPPTFGGNRSASGMCGFSQNFWGIQTWASIAWHHSKFCVQKTYYKKYNLLNLCVNSTFKIVSMQLCFYSCCASQTSDCNASN